MFLQKELGWQESEKSWQLEEFRNREIKNCCLQEELGWRESEKYFSQEEMGWRESEKCSCRNN